jgi:hypothetical protein
LFNLFIWQKWWILFYFKLFFQVFLQKNHKIAKMHHPRKTLDVIIIAHFCSHLEMWETMWIFLNKIQVAFKLLNHMRELIHSLSWFCLNFEPCHKILGWASIWSELYPKSNSSKFEALKTMAIIFLLKSFLGDRFRFKVLQVCSALISVRILCPSHDPQNSVVQKISILWK